MAPHGRLVLECAARVPNTCSSSALRRSLKWKGGYCAKLAWSALLSRSGLDPAELSALIDLATISSRTRVFQRRTFWAERSMCAAKRRSGEGVRDRAHQVACRVRGRMQGWAGAAAKRARARARCQRPVRDGQRARFLVALQEIEPRRPRRMQPAFVAAPAFTSREAVSTVDGQYGTGRKFVFHQEDRGVAEIFGAANSTRG